MARGTVSRIIRGEFGFITPDEAGPEVYFRVQWLRNAPLTGVAVGLRVEYEVRPTPRGLQTQSVRVIGTEPSTPQRGAGQRHLPVGYRFLNPYNFVRALPEKDSGDPLLGRCPPPPHDRYVGLTGQITCELTAVTPLFTGDAASVVRDESKLDHYHYQFFRYDGEPAIPATSLRGSIRAVFEAATNSCFAVLAAHQRLSQHFDSRKAPELVPARVEKVEDGWQLRLLTGATPLQVNRPPSGQQYAAWLHAYWPLRPSGTLRQTPPLTQQIRQFQERRRKGTEVKPHSLQHGDACCALLEDVQHPFPRIRFWDVIDVVPVQDRASLERRRRPNQRIEQGWLCITNQNIEPKHSERFFFRARENRIGPVTIELPKDARDSYEDLIADYQERHADAVHKRGKSPHLPLGPTDVGLSRFIYTRSERQLHGGELVYAYLDGSPMRPEVKFIVPVSVPRVGYEHQIGDLLEGKNKCEQIDLLCPACRTFGWVWGTDDLRQETPDADVRTAYASRVRFRHAKLTHDAGTFDATLAILSSPKPTTVRFYLRAKDNQAEDGRDDAEVNYDAEGQVLRGRKFYRHHGDQLQAREYLRAEGERDDQNRTVHGVQQPGSKFTFALHFDNLAPVELGALLWALELEGWHHRIGLGKPLGFGSATVRVTELRTLNPRARYAVGATGWDDSISSKESWITTFKTAMQERYGAPFHDLVNICDLRALLATTPPLPVHYPRTDQEPAPEGKNFEWFMGNNRAGRNAGPRLTLRLAEEDTEGLPLLDKSGQVR